MLLTSHIATRLILDKKEQKLIDDFLKCCFENIINEAQEYIKDVNYDNAQIINEILECIEEIKKIENEMKKDLSDLYPKDEKIKKMIDKSKQKIKTLSEYLIISNISRFLSESVLIWKYNGEYEKLSYPKYYAIIKTPILNEEHILNKIGELKEYFGQKDKSWNPYKIIFNVLKTINMMFVINY